MKKTISANIGGILFYLEEEAYELLRAYLENLTSTEAVESKIAEIFLDKLIENKPFISLEDVKQTLQSLGEDIELLAATVPPMQVSPHFEKKEDKTYSHESLSTKKLYRDTSRKLIGGVASGIAYYFEIDPSWVRLLFLLPSLELLGEGDFFVRLALLLYVVLWLLMPANAYLPEQTEVRRFFRNPYERFIAGVCSGFSYFLGIEVVFIRVVFLLSSFTGVGIVVYLLVWIITPLASQPLLYQRPPITLEDIEGKIKSFLGQKKMIAVLFLPLRWLSDLLKGSPKMSLRRGFYLMVSLLGMFMMIVAAVSIACLFCGAFVYWTSLYPESGFLWLSEHSEGNNRLVWDTFRHALSGHMVFFLLLFTEIPFIFLGMGGWAVLKRRWTFSNRVSWSLGVVWLIGLIGTSITVPMALLDFQAKGSYKNTVTYLPPANGKIYLELNDNCSDNFLNVELTIEGHEKNTIELIQHYQAQGRDRSQAVAYAKTIEYQVQFNDSIVCFDKAIRIAEGVPFRGQHLTMKVLLPYQRPFYLSPKMATILRRTLTPYGYNANDLAENSTWLFDENGLQCLNCPLQRTATRKDKKKILQPSVGQFRKIHIEGNYIVRILPADSYEVKAICGKDIHRINLVQEDGRLIISEKENDDRYIQLVIRVRELEEIALGGKVRAKLDGLKEKNLHISLWDSASLEALVTTDSLVAHLSAYSRLVLTGKSETFEAFLTGTSEVVAEGFPVEKVSIEAGDISKVNVNALQEIQINRSSNSLVDYVGKPQKIFIHQE